MKKVIINIEKEISQFCSNLVSTFVSILRVCLLSSIKIAVRSKKYSKIKESDTCIVLGNGPSLKSVLKEGGIKKDDGDIMCVNMFCKSEYFKQIKPRYYLLCDGGYFNPQKERVIKIVEELISSLNTVDWPLYLVIPSKAKADCHLIKSIDNDNISILRMNHTEVGGFKFFRHLLYSIRLGMPRCETVINYALMTAINFKYNQILLYGADHTWIKDIWVGDDNRVYTGDPHLYDNKQNCIMLPHDLSEELISDARVFASHKRIRQYCDSKKIRIINKTKGSYIDAYERQ